VEELPSRLGRPVPRKRKSANNIGPGSGGVKKPLNLARFLWKSWCAKQHQYSHRSHLFDTLLMGASDLIEYTINGNLYKTGYYLANGIYPSWSTLVYSI
jgi:hypothetical protein